jgi:hypothetical protein
LEDSNRIILDNLRLSRAIHEKYNPNTFDDLFGGRPALYAPSGNQDSLDRFQTNFTSNLNRGGQPSHSVQENDGLASEQATYFKKLIQSFLK